MAARGTVLRGSMSDKEMKGSVLTAILGLMQKAVGDDLTCKALHEIPPLNPDQQALESFNEDQKFFYVCVMAGKVNPPMAIFSPLFFLAPFPACRYLVKDFGTSKSPKSTHLRDNH